MRKILRVPIDLPAEEAKDLYDFLESLCETLHDAYHEEFIRISRRRLIAKLEDEDGIDSIEERVPF